MLELRGDRAAPGKAWWKRNLNLKFSRKLTVYSTVLAIVAKSMSTLDDFALIGGMIPLERLAFALDTIGDDQLLGHFASVLDDYEDFLAAKSHAELEAKDEGQVAAFSVKAQRFDDFLHQCLRSDRIDQSLVRYVTI